MYAVLQSKNHKLNPTLKKSNRDRGKLMLGFGRYLLLYMQLR